MFIFALRLTQAKQSVKCHLLLLLGLRGRMILKANMYDSLAFLLPLYYN